MHHPHCPGTEGAVLQAVTWALDLAATASDVWKGARNSGKTLKFFYCYFACVVPRLALCALQPPAKRQTGSGQEA
eukprot:1269179-Amphidinium_carterae.1